MGRPGEEGRNEIRIAAELVPETADRAGRAGDRADRRAGLDLRAVFQRAVDAVQMQGNLRRRQNEVMPILDDTRRKWRDGGGRGRQADIDMQGEGGRRAIRQRSGVGKPVFAVARRGDAGLGGRAGEKLPVDLRVGPVVLGQRLARH
jgi:hypothetical protein